MSRPPNACKASTRRWHWLTSLRSCHSKAGTRYCSRRASGLARLWSGSGRRASTDENAAWALRELEAGDDVPPGFVFTEIAAPEGCALDDEDAWRAANPGIDAGFMAIDALRTAVKMSTEEDFRRFRLGQWVEGVGSWLGEDALQW